MILSQKESIWYDYLKIDLWLKWGKRFVKRFLDEETFWQIFLVAIGLTQQLSYYLSKLYLLHTGVTPKTVSSDLAVSFPAAAVLLCLIVAS